MTAYKVPRAATYSFTKKSGKNTMISQPIGYDDVAKQLKCKFTR